MIDEDEIYRMVNSADVKERKKAAVQLRDNFASLSDKDTAWADLIQFTQDKKRNVRKNAARALGSCFSAVPDKATAWSDLYRLTQDGDSFVRSNAAKALGSCFSAVPDKATAWSDLYRLTQDGDSFVRSNAAKALGSCFYVVPDKTTAWSDLIRLTQDEKRDVRWEAAEVLGSCFSAVPDKATAWSDLIWLTQDENSDVRWEAAKALGSCFSAIPDKENAWSDLIQLTQDEDIDVRRTAAKALGSCFSAVPDKENAWSDLHRLTQDEDSFVRSNVAKALGSCFSAVPDKENAWSDLHQLTQDDYSDDVVIYAYHSLGSASVYKATEEEGEENFKENIRIAIDYFKKSSRESFYKFVKPAGFCLPFYRSYYAIISEKQEAEAEAVKYLDKAEKATKGSESKEALLKAVENLANALKEAQNPNFGEKKEHLRACRQYCDHTAELADSARGKSPVAAAAIERGIPIVGVKVKEIIAEIQEKAKEACRQAQGTPAEEIACGVNQEVQKWVIGDQEELTLNIEKLIFSLQSKIPRIPLNEHIHEEIEKIRDETDLTKQYAMVSHLIISIPTNIHIGDNITIKDVKVGDNSQIIGKGNENKNTSEKTPDITHKSPKTSIFMKKSKN